MLIEATTPRILLKPSEHPEHVYIHTLRKTGVSRGDVIFGAYATGGRLPPGTEPPSERVTIPDDGSRALTPYREAPVRTDGSACILEPQWVFPIEGEPGFEALEYVLPFWELFRQEDKSRNLALVPFCTGGFSVTVRSAFRSDPRTYDERVMAFQIHMPVTGSGIIRLGDSTVDINNTTFDPWAPNPKVGMPFKNLELADIFNRTHRLGNRSAIDERRAARIREAEASMALEAQRDGRKLLPGGS